MVLIVVGVVPAGSKPPEADDSMRTSTGGRCGFGASAPLLSRAAHMYFLGAIKRGSAIMPKLINFVGPSSTLAEELSPFINRSAAASSVRLRVLVYGSTSASVARLGCRASCCRPVKC